MSTTPRPWLEKDDLMPLAPVEATVTTPGSWVGMSKHSDGSITRSEGVASFGETGSLFSLPAAATFTAPFFSAYREARATASTSAFWSGSFLQLKYQGSV